MGIMYERDGDGILRQSVVCDDCGGVVHGLLLHHERTGRFTHADLTQCRPRVTGPRPIPEPRTPKSDPR
jgi:hypothetical protein